MTTRRTSLVAALALVLLGLTVSPARAATGPTRLAGPQTTVLRGSGPSTAAPALVRDTAIIGGDPTPASHHYSTWDIDYVGSWTTDAQAAFQRAADQWASIVHSSVPISVHAEFADLGPGVLGSAGPDGIEKEPTLGDGVSWYPDALADALAGTDMAPGYYDIDASFSSTEPDIYYGTDGNPPAGFIDFESVVLHELGHGLGFTGSSAYDDKGTSTLADDTGSFGPNVLVFDKFLETSAGTSLLSLPNSSTTLGTAYRNPVFWKGGIAKAANGNAHVAMYAPSAWQEGSSIAHMDETTFGTGTVNSLMTPYINNQEVVHRPGPVTLGIFQDMGWVATLGVPGKVTGLAATTAASEIDLTWDEPADNGSAVTGYTITQTDGTASTTTTLTSAGTSKAVTGLDPTHTYAFTVSATNAVGDGPASDSTGPISPTPDTTAPTVSFFAPNGAYKPATSSLGFAGTDPGNASSVLTYTCALDAAAPTACTSPYGFSGLSAGAHTLSVRAKDASGNETTPAATLSFTVDPTPPTVTANALPVFTLASTVGLRYSGADSGSGVASYDVRYRKAAFNGAFGGLVTQWHGVTATVETMPALRGYTYCFSVLSRDKAGQTSPWSPERCTATALDDRSLAASSGWSRGTSSAYYASTVTSVAAVARTLTRTSVQARRVYLVATTCKGCGSVGVYWNGSLLRSVSLNATSTTYKHVIAIKDFGAVRSGTLVLKTLNSGRTYVDGVTLSRA